MKGTCVHTMPHTAQGWPGRYQNIPAVPVLRFIAVANPQPCPIERSQSALERFHVAFDCLVELEWILPRSS